MSHQLLPVTLAPHDHVVTHDSSVCFVPCLAGGTEINAEQEAGAVPSHHLILFF